MLGMLMSWASSDLLTYPARPALLGRAFCSGLKGRVLSEGILRQFSFRTPSRLLKN